MDMKTATNAELTEIVFGKSVKEDDLFLFEATSSYMGTVNSTKGQKAKIEALHEIAYRLYGNFGKKLHTATDVYPVLAHMATFLEEHFVVVSLDGAHKIKEMRTISKGIANKTIVHPREVFSGAITDRASAILVAHNHPSGQMEPSPEDIAITTRLKEAGDILGITVLDHLIIGNMENPGYFSFVESGTRF